MRLLFEMDKKDYDHCTDRFVRNSARSIIIRDGRIAMIHSLKYDYYKFPGGGIENGENPVEAMIRETREEAGLVVKPETVKEYGYVHRIQRSDMDASECFAFDTYETKVDTTEEDEVNILTSEDWQAESVVIREYAAFDFNEIMNLYTSVGWTNYTDHPQMLEKAYKNSLCTLGAYTAQGRLVGIIRAVGDGASILFIQDIIVLPEFQRKGIGTDLLRAIIRRYPDVYQTELMTDNTDKTIAFYKSLGFTPATEFGCLGFMKLNT